MKTTIKKAMKRISLDFNLSIGAMASMTFLAIALQRVHWTLLFIPAIFYAFGLYSVIVKTKTKSHGKMVRSKNS